MMGKQQQGRSFLTRREITAWPVLRQAAKGESRKERLKQSMVDCGLDGPMQIAGNHFAMGCVALEITQRCNLDCSACYLSDYSELVSDLPLEEVFRRIDQIHEHFGPRTNVQITGGDPTLRKREELVAIVERIASRDLRPALFTNGIKATRSLLTDLKKAGLKDVAFHVDMTQDRKAYRNETALSQIRNDYIERARGLGLQIIFNTTVFPGNVDDIPMLANFFAERAQDVHLASFQMIADTGRGTVRNRNDLITQERVTSLISKGAGTKLVFDFPQIGHLDCNLYAKCITAGGKRVSAFQEEDRALFEKLLPITRDIFLSRYQPFSSVFTLLKKLFVGHFVLIPALIAYIARKAKGLGRGLIKSHGRVHLLTFYIHNFMHEDHLDHARCKACVFMTMTRDGPISMCVHNAKRDSFILQGVTKQDGQSWSPLPQERLTPDTAPLKHLKGRARKSRLHQKDANVATIHGNIGLLATQKRKAQTNIYTSHSK